MLKDKLKLIILGTSFILIWSIVGSRTIKMIKTDESNIRLKDNIASFVQIELVIDTFSIDCNYSNPFVVSKKTINKTLSNKNKTPLVLNSQPRNRVQWPEIRYFGIVEAENKKAKTGLFYFNSKNFIGKEGDEYMQIRILKIWRDSSLVSLHGEKKTIIR